jgi:hypothetical protein
MTFHVELFQVQPHEIDKAWRDGAHTLSEATKWASREITPDQLKMLLSRGERTLIGARADGVVLGWAAVSVQQLPNIRILFVHGATGKGIVSAEVLSMLRQYAQANGCTSIRGCVRPSMARLMRKHGGQPLYMTFEMEATP